MWARDELRDEEGSDRGLVAAAKEKASDPHVVRVSPVAERGMRAPPRERRAAA
jgi:hypothetical protein